MAGFPHSDIHGSILACSSPWLFAAYRVLLRLLAPRHPPYALSSLTSFLLSSHFRVPSLVTLSKLLFKRFLSLLFSFFYILFKVHEVLPSKPNNNQSECDRPEVCELSLTLLPRKEVIQPHLPIRLPCYDFTPIIEPTFGRAPLAVRLRTSGIDGSHGVTGGVYKARERIHRGMLIRDY